VINKKKVKFSKIHLRKKTIGMGKNTNLQFIFFKLKSRTYALPLEVVEKVLPLIEITFLEKASQNVIGVINVKGEIIPVLDLTSIFRVKDFKITLNSKIIIAKAGRYKVGFVVDEVEGYRELPQDSLINPEEIWTELKDVKGIIRLKDGNIILINDIEGMLSLKEVNKLKKEYSNLKNG
jgi:chemotaxis signal transduction protein